MSIRKILISLAILLPSAAIAQQLNYTETDPEFETGGHFTVGIDKSLAHKKLVLSLEEEMRLNDNFCHVNRFYTTVGAEYKVFPWLKAGLSYALVANNSETKGWGLRHRGSVALTESVKLGRWKISLRERVQVTYRADSVNLFQSPQTAWTLKTRLKTSYDIPRSPFKPYFSAEAKFVLNGVNPKNFVCDPKSGRWSNPEPKYNDFYFNRVRFKLGSEYKINRKNLIDFFVVADLCYDLDIDFNSSGKQKKDPASPTGYADYLFLKDSYFAGVGFTYTFSL
ncbi:MAG: DUF2490 domain-containing protein [Clostridium sp.]|nr:DUF2490 domain-containing protein [Bacteroides sp.]MCM1198167.1 DUF2490 domain-containing protein [Clostridium sp.]